jgi:hypothetical protein
MAAYVTLRSNRFDGEMLLIDGITRILGVNLLDALAGSFKLPDFRHGSFREQFATAADLATWLMQQLPAAIARWQDVLDACYDALPQVKPERRTFFVDHFVVQAEIMYGLYAWCHSLAQAVAEHETGNAAAARQRLSDALFHMQKLLLDRRKAEHGAWQDWYRGDKKMNLPGIVDRMKVLLETKGEAQ